MDRGMEEVMGKLRLRDFGGNWRTGRLGRLMVIQIRARRPILHVCHHGEVVGWQGGRME